MKSKIFAVLVLFLLTAITLTAAERSFIIMHSNDRHGYVEARKDLNTGKPVAGLDVEATMIGQIRKGALKEGIPTLLVDAGDFFQGTPVVNETKGEVMIRVMNELRYDFVTFGNHEFDYGWQNLKKRMDESRFWWLSSTVSAPSLGARYRPYLTWSVAGTKVAFLGATTVTTPEKQLSQRIVGMTFRSPYEVLPPLVERLRRLHGVKIFILLSHLGHYEDEKFVREHQCFDIVIGGHSHTALMTPIKIGKTWICQTGASSRFLGVMRVDVNKDGNIEQFKSELREVDRTKYLPDAKVAKLVASYTDEIDKRLSVVVGHAPTDIRKGVSGGYSPMAQVVAESFRVAANADIGLMNTGGTRRGILKGEVQLKEVQTAVPFRNYVVKLKMTGRQVKGLIEEAVNGPYMPIPADKQDLLRQYGIHDFAGLVPQRGHVGFLVGGGVQFVYDPRLPIGKRLLSFKLHGKAIEPEKVYTVATNDFLADGGDGFEEFKKAISREELGILDADALRAYFEKKKVVHCPQEASAVNLSFPTVAAKVSQ